MLVALIPQAWLLKKTMSGRNRLPPLSTMYLPMSSTGATSDDNWFGISWLMARNSFCTGYIQARDQQWRQLFDTMGVAVAGVWLINTNSLFLASKLLTRSKVAVCSGTEGAPL